MFEGITGHLRDWAKVIAFSALGSAPVLRQRLHRVRDAGVNIILNLHRVSAHGGSSDYRPLHPDLLDDLLVFVKQEFSVVTIGQLSDPSRKPKLVLSFDDGYRDFALHAAPVLQRHGLAANLNIIPKCVEIGLPPLNVMAQDFVAKAPVELIRRLRIDGFSAPTDRYFGPRLSYFLKMRPQAEQDDFARELVPQFYNWGAFEPTPMLSLDELKSLKTVELGAHSYRHSSMEFETDEYLDEDVRRCAAFFRVRLRRPMPVYAFPNGSCRKGQAQQVLEHGVDHVLLVGERFDRGTCIHNRLTFDARSRREVLFKALGGRAAI